MLCSNPFRCVCDIRPVCGAHKKSDAVGLAAMTGRSAVVAPEPETVTYEHDRAEVPPLREECGMKNSNGDLISRSVIHPFGEFADKVTEHIVLTGTMGSGKTRQTMNEVSSTVTNGVNVVELPRIKLAINQQRAYSAIYGRCVFNCKIQSLLPEGETLDLMDKIKLLDAKVDGKGRSGNMDIAAREQLLARLGQGYTVYTRMDKVSSIYSLQPHQIVSTDICVVTENAIPCCYPFAARQVQDPHIDRRERYRHCHRTTEAASSDRKETKISHHQLVYHRRAQVSYGDGRDKVSE